MSYSLGERYCLLLSSSSKSSCASILLSSLFALLAFLILEKPRYLWIEVSNIKHIVINPIAIQYIQFASPRSFHLKDQREKNANIYTAHPTRLPNLPTPD